MFFELCEMLIADFAVRSSGVKNQVMDQIKYEKLDPASSVFTKATEYLSCIKIMY